MAAGWISSEDPKQERQPLIITEEQNPQYKGRREVMTARKWKAMKSKRGRRREVVKSTLRTAESFRL